MEKSLDGELVIAEEEIVYERLCKLVSWLAGVHQSSNCPMLSYDELVAELNLKMVEGMIHYKDKPLEERIVIIRRMFDNHIKDLKRTHYGTARADLYNANNPSLDQDSDDEGSDWDEEYVMGLPMEASPEAIYSSKERVKRIRSLLSPKSKQVFDALIYGNTQVALQAYLSLKRSEQMFRNPTVKLSLEVVGSALGLHPQEVANAFRDIKHVAAAI